MRKDKMANQVFHSPKKYWCERYSSGKYSGAGSYGKFADYKADVINSFVSEKKHFFCD